MDKTANEVLVEHQTNWLQRYGIVVVVYILATWFTDAYSMGDTRHYVADILGASKYKLWEFGHILWRPVGRLLASILYPLTRLSVGEDPHANVTLTLMGINWIAGLVGVLLVHALASKFCKRGWIIYLVTAGFLFSNAFLNYTQTGHSYVPGLTLLLLALYLLASRGDKPDHSLRTAALAGISLAGAVLMWFPYILSVPAIAVSPLFLFGFGRPQVRLALQAAVVSALTVALVYFLVILYLGIYNMAELKVWIMSSSHGMDNMKGIPRMVFGFARSLINMGNDGRLFKRYVVGDPLNPVSLFDLFRFSLWKLLLFYLFFFSLLINLFFSQLGKRTLALLFLSAAPLVVFALFLFESGTIDRYLPLYPMLFLSLAVSLRNDKLRSLAKFAALAFVAVATISNVSAMSTVVLDREQERAASRIRDLLPLLKQEKSRVVTVVQHDPIYALNANFPFNPINRRDRLSPDVVVDPGTVQVLAWRIIFAAKTLALWQKGGDVWVTKRVFHPRPQPDWEWVEGDDKRTSWADIYDFFSQLEVGQAVGGEDGFVLVSRTPKNEQFLNGFAQQSK